MIFFHTESLRHVCRISFYWLIILTLIAHVKILTLTTSLVESKIEDLNLLIAGLDYKFIVIGLSETWNSESSKKNLTLMLANNFQPYICILCPPVCMETTRRLIWWTKCQSKQWDKYNNAFLRNQPSNTCKI